MEQALEVPMLIAALLVVPLVVIDLGNYGDPWETVGTALNWLTWSAFFLEACVMLVLVEDRARWVRHHSLDLGVVILTPPFLPALAPVRLFRLLRLLRLLRLARVAQRLFTQEGLRAAALLSALVAVVGGTGYSTLEPHTSPTEGVYWAITTMTTVGYGDVSPTTTGGKALALVIMLVGIGFVAILTGAIAQKFVERSSAEEVREVEAEVDAASSAIIDELRAVRVRLDSVEASIMASRRR